MQIVDGKEDELDALLYVIAISRKAGEYLVAWASRSGWSLPGTCSGSGSIGPDSAKKDACGFMGSPFGSSNDARRLSWLQIA